MERATWLERRFGAEVEWQPFDLHPEYPPDGIPSSELARRYGADFGDRQNQMFAEAGLPFASERQKVPNSRRSLMLGELARERGVYEALHPRLFDAYWARNLDLGDQEVLVAEGTAVGLDPGDVEAALGDRRYLEQVELATQSLTELGGSGVPAWLIDRRVLVPGAQPHDVFERVLERLGHAPGGDA